METENAFLCKNCHSMWCEPVTFPCGETMCKECTVDGFICCKSCNEYFDKEKLQINMLLSRLQEKLLPSQQLLLSSKKNIIQYFKNQNYDTVLALIASQLQQYSNDIFLLNLQCKSFLKIDKIQEASNTAQKIIEMSPSSVLGYNRKFDISNKLHLCDIISSDSNNDNASNFKGNSTSSLQNNSMSNTSISRRDSILYEKYDLSQLKKLFTLEDFECIVCSRLLYEPMTTPCGHVFCIECLYRSLDFRASCPLCKDSLTEIITERRSHPTHAILLLIKQLFPSAFKIRRDMYLNEISPFINSSSLISLPVFVCTTAYPSIECPLHIFEPRYRLMMRRCLLNGSRLFGMCSKISGDSKMDVGTSMFIEEMKFLEDGRSVMRTIGISRFHILASDLVDGYCVANIQYIYDKPIANLKKFNIDSNQVYKKFQQWLSTLNARQHITIAQAYGNLPPFTTMPKIQLQSSESQKQIIEIGYTDLPSCAAGETTTSHDVEMRSGLATYEPVVTPTYDMRNGPAWFWYAIAILPMHERLQHKMLRSQDPEMRLCQIEELLTTLQSRS